MSDMEVARNLLAGPLDDSQRRTLLRTEHAAVLSDPDQTSAVVHLSSEVLVTQALPPHQLAPSVDSLPTGGASLPTRRA